MRLVFFVSGDFTSSGVLGGRLRSGVLTVGVLGAGTVGTQVIRLLTTQSQDFAARSGARLEITGIAVRNTSAPRDPAVPAELVTDDALSVATSNDLVIELIGGIEPARSLVLAAFKAGASVISGNKALIAAHGPELYDAAAEAGTDFAKDVSAFYIFFWK